MHVESVLFENLNYYAAIGVLSTTDSWKLVLGALLLIVLTALFRVDRPQRRKPNLPWSLLCVAVFALGAVKASSMALTSGRALILKGFWKRT